MPEIIVKLGDRVIQRYHFDKEVLSIGRARDNDIVIENLSVSRNHARIKKQDGKYFIVDMNSANGSLVNGVRVTQAELAHDDLVSIGKHSLHFTCPEDAGSGSAAPSGTGASSASSSGVRPDSPSRVGADLPSAGTIGLLVVTKGKQAGQQFRVFKPETFIGRANENEIRLHDWFVSKRHAAIERRGDVYIMKDLDSWRGTTVNGSNVREIELNEGDEIVFGTTVLQFRRVDVADLPKPAPAGPHSSTAVPILPAQESRDWVEPLRIPAAESDGSGDAIPAPPGIAKPPSSASRPALHRPAPPQEDEFAPMSPGEMEALEAEADSLFHEDSGEEGLRASWELLEAERMFEMPDDAPADAKKIFLDTEEEMAAGEDAAVLRDSSGGIRKLRGELKPAAVSDADAADEEIAEEESLYGGPMGDSEPFGDSMNGAAVAAPPAIAAPPPPAAAIPATAPVSASSTKVPVGTAADDSASRGEVAMWEKAMKNKSQIIRKNAAKQLKKLTGKDYDWQSEPSGT